MDFKLPPEFEAFAEMLTQESPEVHAVMRNGLVLLMIDHVKARDVETRIIDGKQIMRVRNVNGEEFEIERPAISPDAESMLLDELRKIIATD